MSKNEIQICETFVSNASEKFKSLPRLFCIKGSLADFMHAPNIFSITLVDQLGKYSKRIQEIEEIRDFVRTSRYEIENLEQNEQDYIAAWLQKFIAIMESKNFTINKDQQTFISNLRKLIGIKDEFIQIENIELLTNFGNRNIHEIIYSIYLVLCYLFNCSFDELSKFSDIDNLFKLSIYDKNRILMLVKNQIKNLGADDIILIYDPFKLINSFFIENAILRFIPITSHPLMKANISIDIKNAYIIGFTLLAQKTKSFNKLQRIYIQSLATLFQCKECVYEIDNLCLKQKMINIIKWIDIFDSDMSDMMLYSWILDAAYIVCLDENLSDLNDKNNLLTDVTKIFKKADLSEIITLALQLCSSEEPNELLQAIKKIYKFSEGWNHILKYRNLSFKNAFINIRHDIQTKCRDINKIQIEGRLLVFKALNIARMMSGGDKIDKVKYKYIKSNISYRVHELKKYKEKTIAIIDSIYSIIYKFYSLTEIISDIYKRKFTMIKRISYLNINLDSSILNNNWYNNFSFLVNSLDDALKNTLHFCDEFDNALKLSEQSIHFYIDVDKILELFKHGIYDILTLEIERRYRPSVTPVAYDPIQNTLKIDWEYIFDMPFDIKDIRQIITDGKRFLLECKLNIYSFTNNTWKKIDFNTDEYFNKIIYINGYWIVIYNNKYYFSQTLIDWKTIDLSNNNFRIKNILYYNGEWVLFSDSCELYSYIEKGIMGDYQTTDSYFKPKFYRSHSLDGEWEVWKSASSLREGIIIEEICVYDGKLIANFDYNELYKNRKGILIQPYIAYIQENCCWRKTTLFEILKKI